MGHFYLGQEFSEHNTQQKQKVHIYKGLVVYDKQCHVTCTVKQDFNEARLHSSLTAAESCIRPDFFLVARMLLHALLFIKMQAYHYILIIKQCTFVLLNMSLTV